MRASCGHDIGPLESHYRYADGRTACNECAGATKQKDDGQQVRGLRASQIKGIEE